ncbi:YjzD family protein [Bacillus sp. CGMCC 1.16607]|uniref:YjzD family protein n=1 Tax=Bacillus sp. CGMCC 1.16607 TaxID=3351842 RepID=UPI0036387418
MRYFWTLFWTFLLVQMLNYVVTSMTGTTYDFNTGTIISVIVAVLIFVVTLVIPNEPVDHHEAH